MKKSLTLLSSLLCSSLLSFGQTAEPAAPAAPASGLTISGYVDTYYQYNLSKSKFNRGRVFDQMHNNFSIGLAQTMFTYRNAKSEMVIDLTFGPNAELGNFGNFVHPYIQSSNGAGLTGMAIKQARYSYNFTDKLKFTVGQFGTHIGYELIDAPLNYNYSLSYLFGNGPFYHTGAKIDYAFSDKFAIMAGVVNGWDAMIDFNDKKSIAAQVFLKPVDKWNIYLNYIGGDEYKGASAFGTVKGSRTDLLDLTTTFQATDAFKIGLNAAYGMFKSGGTDSTQNPVYNKDGSWYGAALYLNYAINETYGIGARYEHFNDEKGYRYNGALVVNAVTLTGDIKLADGRFTIKPEVRYDMSKDEFFFDEEGNATKKNQTTIGAAVIYTY